MKVVKVFVAVKKTNAWRQNGRKHGNKGVVSKMVLLKICHIGKRQTCGYSSQSAWRSSRTPGQI